MKLAQLLQTVYSEPSLITAEAHASIRQLLESRLFGGEPFVREPGKGACGETVEVEQMQIADGIAYIPINGAIGQKLDPFERGEGAVDVLDVAREIDEAEDSAEVGLLFFDIDSPGGMVTGTPELAARMSRIEKPAYAFTNGMMASAAYWLGSSLNAIYTTPTANVGSIGVYLPVLDVSGWYASKGVKVEVIKAGKLKGIGFPGTSLSKEQRAHLQQRVDDIYRMFAGAVIERRGARISEDTMQGQTFLAAEAFDRGLIDGIVPDRASALRKILEDEGLA